MRVHDRKERQFRVYLPGMDVRVQVVGERVFPCEIDSDVVDYRYARRQGGRARPRPSTLPTDVADRCRPTSGSPQSYRIRRRRGVTVNYIDF
ncbi:MAG: hypothetical protein MJE77_33210 [Proteobacteria bacterium]|nr:hypothetical protein [Pseudomonadota bacterium]